MKSKKSRQHEDMKWIPKIKAPSKHKTKTKKSGQHQDTKQTQKRILSLPASMPTIMVLTASSGRNKAHGKGIKLVETGRYLARRGRLTEVFPSPLRCAEIATPAKRRWWVHCGCSERSQWHIKFLSHDWVYEVELLLLKMVIYGHD